MGPFSHVVTAHLLELFFNPINKNEYYWGSVAPDVRYLLNNAPRKQTHLSAVKLLEVTQKYPTQKDFLKGYLIHCLSDKLEIKPIMLNKFPFYFIKNRITKTNSSVILEYLNIELINDLNISLSGSYNQFFKEIGVDKESVQKFSNILSNYINSPSSESSLLLYRKLGFRDTKRIDKYENLYLTWNRKWFKHGLQLLTPQLRKINMDLVNQVKIQLSEVQNLSILL